MHRVVFSIGFCLIAVLAFAQAPEDYEKNLEEARQEKESVLKSRKDSPLQKADRKAFTHLNYFDIDPQWRMEVEFRRVHDGDVIDMPTSAGVAKKFQVYGYLVVIIEDKNFSVMTYKRIWPEGSPHKPDHETLFIPFMDMTTGNSTYGGGRYMDIEIPADGDMVVLDFNTCYNPYCAYGTGFSCPIPPPNSFIKAEVTAGEKNYGEH